MKSNEPMQTIKNKELTKKIGMGSWRDYQSWGFCCFKKREQGCQNSRCRQEANRPLFGGLNQLIEAYVVENDYWILLQVKNAVFGSRYLAQIDHS